MRLPSFFFTGLFVCCVLLTLFFLTSASLFLETAPVQHNPEIEVTLWAKQPMLRNPVAISHDPMGRLYVTEANRRKSADLDVRNMRDLVPLPWPVVDYSIQSVPDRQKVIHEYLAPDSPFSNPWLVDYNGDGQKNWHDLLAKTERINLLEDTNGDGQADKASVFAEGFNTEVTGTAAGVLWHNDKVYFTVIPDLWVLEDNNNDGVADARDVLITGHGVHIGQGGHDLHGLTVGPDGRIYWSVGDKGANITSKEGRHFNYPNQGLVMRSEPDGSNFEVFAHGLRNCMELSFDNYGNLFCVDNDGDFKGERERLLYVTRDSDTGWRINWQYNHTGDWAKSVGLPDYNPWLDERLHVPHFKGQAAYITPTLANYSDGPAGFTRNPGTALSEAYEDYYFLTQFPGQKITAFQLAPKGAAFEMKNEHVFQSGFMATGLSFGPEGALYVADWAGNWDPTEDGGIFKLDVQPAAKHPLRKQTQTLIQEGMKIHATDKLVALLAYPDQRVRLAAQFELVYKGAAEKLTQTALDQTANILARVHSLWGLGQLARTNRLTSQLPVTTLLADEDPQVQIQTCRLISEAPALFSSFEPALADLLLNKNPSVQLHAAQALGAIGTDQSVVPLFDLLSANTGNDPFIRHGAVTGLAGIGNIKLLTEANTNSSNNVRLGAVLALRRLHAPAITAFLNDADPLVVLEAARAIHDDAGIPDAMPALAALLNNTPHTSNEALMRRILNANLRLGDEANAEAVVTFFQSGKNNRVLQNEALGILMSWSQPPVLDRVERRYRKLPARDPQMITRLLNDHLPALLSNSGNDKTIHLLQRYNVPLDPALLQKQLADTSRTTAEHLAIFDVLASQPEQQKQALRTALESENTLLRMEALGVLAAQHESDAVARIAGIVASSTHMKERQQAILLLDNLNGKRASKLKEKLAKELKEGQTGKAEQLEVYMATSDDAKPPYSYSMYGGDATRGEQIFLQHPAAQCIRCHAINEGEGSNVGPALKGIGGRFDRAYLLESLVSPGARLAAGFENTAGVSPMPPMGDLLSPMELRDLMAYLAAL